MAGQEVGQRPGEDGSAVSPDCEMGDRCESRRRGPYQDSVQGFQGSPDPPNHEVSLSLSVSPRSLCPLLVLRGRDVNQHSEFEFL